MLSAPLPQNSLDEIEFKENKATRAVRIGALILVALMSVFFALLGYQGILLSDWYTKHIANLNTMSDTESKFADVLTIEGTLYLQRQNQLTFTKGSVGDSVAEGDFLMSAPHSRAVIRLKDGSELELQPGTLAQFPTRTKALKQSIYRSETMTMPEILSGTATISRYNSARKEKNSPVKIAALKPKKFPLASTFLRNKEALEIARISEIKFLNSPEKALSDFSKMPGLTIQNETPETVIVNLPTKSLSPPTVEVLLPSLNGHIHRAAFSPLPVKQRLEMRIKHENQGELFITVRKKNTRAIYERSLDLGQQMNPLTFADTVSLEEPGVYLVTVRLDANVLSDTSFTLDSAYKGIQWLKPTILGSQRLDNLSVKYFEQKFALELGWKYKEKPKNQTLTLSRSGRDQVMDLRAKDRTFISNDFAFFLNPVEAKLRATEKNGFIAESETLPIEFKFLPPKLAVPSDRASVSWAQTMKKSDKGLLFTFGKAAFSEKYEFELGRDIQFKQIEARATAISNLVIVKKIRTGSYFWRVRSVNRHGKSAFSRPFQLVVRP